MKLDEISRALDAASTFSAAHSMDSGWFAVDRKGQVAHFDTGEAGAMPIDAKLATGESGAGPDPWSTYVLPWLARQNGADATSLHPEGLFCALFETEEAAQVAGGALASAGALPSNPCLLEVSPGPDEDVFSTLSTEDGFIGFAPSHDDLFEDDSLREQLPIAFYGHGEWDIPGDYRRPSFTPHTDLKASVESDAIAQLAEKMDVDFAEAESIQLADFYENEECPSWSEADLRSGAPTRQPRATSAKTGKAQMVIVTLLLLAFFLYLWLR